MASSKDKTLVYRLRIVGFVLFLLCIQVTLMPNFPLWGIVANALVGGLIPITLLYGLTAGLSVSLCCAIILSSFYGDGYLPLHLVLVPFVTTFVKMPMNFGTWGNSLVSSFLSALAMGLWEVLYFGAQEEAMPPAFLIIFPIYTSCIGMLIGQFASWFLPKPQRGLFN